jgi:hypothetical protein
LMAKTEYTLPEAAVALGRSTEYVRQRLPKNEERRGRGTTITHQELLMMALPGMSTTEPPVMRDGVSYYTKDELINLIRVELS